MRGMWVQFQTKVKSLVVSCQSPCILREISKNAKCKYTMLCMLTSYTMSVIMGLQHDGITASLLKIHYKKGPIYKVCMPTPYTWYLDPSRGDLSRQWSYESCQRRPPCNNHKSLKLPLTLLRIPRGLPGDENRVVLEELRQQHLPFIN